MYYRKAIDSTTKYIAVAAADTELCMVISLTDPSFTDANQKLKCNLFGNGPQLPQIRAVGDIIRLHRLKVWQ
jgi:hypothetical protein